MEIIELIQGTSEWHAYRASAWNASDAPAMLGISPYKTRDELLREKATGITPEVSAQQQRIFDRGHRIEALARPLAQDIVADDISPCVGRDGQYSASFDGITFMNDVAWECKTLNPPLREAMPYEICDDTYGSRLPEHYRVQMEHQAMVSGCERILFTAASLTEDESSLEDVRHCWYTPDSALRARIVAGWAQFEKDLAAWQPTELTAPVVANPVESLPAVFVQVSGALTVAGNLDVVGAALRTFIERIPAKPSTDQEFADADAACKALRKAEDALAQAEDGALAQISDVEQMRRTVADLKNLARTTRLATEKLVKAEKDNRRTEKVMSAKLNFNTHVQRLEVDLKGVRLQIAPPDFAGAIKGLSSLSSIDEKLTAALLAGQAEANMLAGRISNNMKMLDSVPQYAFLFADRQLLAQKDSETLDLIIESRVKEHQQAEAARLEAERQRIRAEEHHKAQMEATEKMKVEQAMAAVEVASHAPLHGQRGTVAYTADWQQSATAENSTAVETMNLSQINAALGFTVSADFLASLGVLPIRQERAAKLYGASEFTTICRLIQEHLARVMTRSLSSRNTKTGRSGESHVSH